jgi:hypothetical protein
LKGEIMKISVTAVDDFRRWLKNLKLMYSVKKNGEVRSNLSRENRIEMENSYLDFIHKIVKEYVRPIVKYRENVDVTQIWIPHELLEEINTLFNSVDPMMIFYTPEDTDRYKGELDDKNVVVFGDNVIIPTRGN